MLSRNHLGDLGASAVNEGVNLGIAGAKLGTTAGLLPALPGIGGAAAGGASIGALAIPIAGVALAALPFAINLAKCGTITSIGCTKRNDSTLYLDTEAAMQQIGYAWEQGQISSAIAQQYLQQLASEASQMQRPTDYTEAPPGGYIPKCGTYENNGGSSTGAPCGSGAANVIPAGATVSLQQQIEAYMQYVSGPSPADASATASATASGAVPGGPTVGAVSGTTATGISTEDLLILGGLGLFLVFIMGGF